MLGEMFGGYVWEEFPGGGIMSWGNVWGKMSRMGVEIPMQEYKSTSGCDLGHPG